MSLSTARLPPTIEGDGAGHGAGAGAAERRDAADVDGAHAVAGDPPGGGAGEAEAGAAGVAEGPAVGAGGVPHAARLPDRREGGGAAHPGGRRDAREAPVDGEARPAVAGVGAGGRAAAHHGARSRGGGGGAERGDHDGQVAPGRRSSGSRGGRRPACAPPRPARWPAGRRGSRRGAATGSGTGGTGAVPGPVGAVAVVPVPVVAPGSSPPRDSSATVTTTAAATTTPPARASRPALCMLRRGP